MGPIAGHDRGQEGGGEDGHVALGEQAAEETSSNLESKSREEKTCAKPLEGEAGLHKRRGVVGAHLGRPATARSY